MNRIAVFPGSFDPFTFGHKVIVDKAISLFDYIFIAVGNNSKKNYMFSINERINRITAVYNNIENIKVISYDGLTVDFCKQKNANFIIRGLRDNADFAFETRIAMMNKKLHSDVETVFFLTSPEYSSISSTIVREIIKNGGDVSKFIPQI